METNPVPSRPSVPGSGTDVSVMGTLWPGRRQLCPVSGDIFVQSTPLTLNSCPFDKAKRYGPLPLLKDSSNTTASVEVVPEPLVGIRKSRVEGVVRAPVFWLTPPKLRKALLTVSGVAETPELSKVTLKALAPWEVVPRY